MTVELRDDMVVWVSDACAACGGEGGRHAQAWTESGWMQCGHCDGSGRAPQRAIPMREFAEALRAYMAPAAVTVRVQADPPRPADLLARGAA